MMLPVILLLSMLMILLSILSVIGHLICGNNLHWLLNLNLIYETLWTGARNNLLISMLGKLKLFCLLDHIKLVLLMWKWMGLFLRKNAGINLLFKMDCSSCIIISIAKTASKKIGTLNCSMQFLSPEVALYLYKSTIPPCMDTVVMSVLVPLVATLNC